MNANATIGTNTNNTNKMNITGLLNPAGDDLLQAISGGGLSALEVFATSDDTFPPLKAAVLEALAIIEIVKVCTYFNYSIMSTYVTALELQDLQERLGRLFGESH